MNHSNIRNIYIYIDMYIYIYANINITILERSNSHVHIIIFYYSSCEFREWGSLEATSGAQAKCGLQHYLDDSGCNGHKAPRSRHGFVFQAWTSLRKPLAFCNPKRQIIIILSVKLSNCIIQYRSKYNTLKLQNIKWIIVQVQYSLVLVSIAY
jgi:hypothetical protein